MCRMIGAAYTLLVLACLACGLSFVSPFWLLYPDVTFNSFVNLGNWGSWLKGSWAEGLFGICTKTYSSDDALKASCTWFWQDDFKWEKSLTDWQKAVQGLFAAGLLLLIIGWMISTFHVCCCRCCKQSFSVGSALGSLTLSGLVLIATAITVFGAYSAKERSVKFEDDTIKFYWAFFVGIAGCALALVSVILFFCDGCRGREHTGYHMTRVV